MAMSGSSPTHKIAGSVICLTYAFEVILPHDLSQMTNGPIQSEQIEPHIMNMQ